MHTVRRGLLAALSLLLLSACAPKNSSSDESIDTPAVLDVTSAAPDFTLNDAHGNTVTLSALTAKKPTLIIYYLGYSCPHCVHHLAALSSLKADFDKVNAQIIAISPDTVAEDKDSISTYGDFDFPLLSDPNMKVAKAYGLVFGTTVFHGAYIVDTRGRIRFAMKSSHPYDNTDALMECFKEIQAEQK